MFLKSYAPGCHAQLTPCPDDHGAGLHVTVGLQASYGKHREYRDRHVCPGGVTEAAVWFQAALAGMVKPGSVPLLLCDAGRLTMVAVDEQGQYRLVLDVPDCGGEEVVDSLGLLVARDDMVAAAQFWQQQAETVVRLCE